MDKPNFKMTAVVCHGPRGLETMADWSVIGRREELDIRGAYLGPFSYPIAIDLVVRGLLEEWDEALRVANSLHAIKVLMRPGYRANA